MHEPKTGSCFYFIKFNIFFLPLNINIIEGYLEG
jgi:hypothetical protein